MGLKNSHFAFFRNAISALKPLMQEIYRKVFNQFTALLTTVTFLFKRINLKFKNEMLMITLLITWRNFSANVFWCVANSSKMPNFDPEIMMYDERIEDLYFDCDTMSIIWLECNVAS